MTTARSNIIDYSKTQYYHCTTKCVQGYFLCGKNMHTGIDYNYRKEWIVELIKKTAMHFSIHICSYAIMSNHYHLVLYVNVELATTMTNDEVLERWGNVYPNDA